MTTEPLPTADSGLFGDDLLLPLYKSVQVQVAVFFGGPLAATYMIAKNFKQFGQPDMVKKTWLYGIGAFIVYVLIVLNIPDNARFVNYVLSIGMIYGVRSLVKQTMGTRLDEHVAQGGKIISNWNVFAVVLVALLILLAVIVPYILYMNPTLTTAE